MRFIWKTHHYGGNLAKFERAKHLLAPRPRRRSVIYLAHDKHRRRLNVLDITDRRSRPEILFLIERRAFEPARLKQCKIGRVPPIRPTGDVALRDGRREAV